MVAGAHEKRARTQTDRQTDRQTLMETMFLDDVLERSSPREVFQPDSIIRDESAELFKLTHSDYPPEGAYP